MDVRDHVDGPLSILNRWLPHAQQLPQWRAVAGDAQERFRLEAPRQPSQSS